VRFGSGGVVMTAGRAGAALTALGALDLVRAEPFTNTDCPEARMAGGNHNNNNNNNKRR
jgi:hypothetical protein